MRGTEFNVDRSNLIQQWDFDEDVCFAVRVDDPDHSWSVVLVVMTLRNERLGRYFGRYVLRLTAAGAAETLRGRTRCDGG